MPPPPCPRQAAPYYASRIITAKWLNVGSPSHNYWNAPWNLGAYGSDYVTNAAIQKFFIIVNKAQDALYYYLVRTSAGPLAGALSRPSVRCECPGGASRVSDQAGSIGAALLCVRVLCAPFGASRCCCLARAHAGLRTGNKAVLALCPLQFAVS